MSGIDDLLNRSLLSPSGIDEDSLTPTSGQKWWAAIILGFVFALVSSPLAYSMTNSVVCYFGGFPMGRKGGPTVPGLFLHTVIFILIARVILW